MTDAWPDEPQVLFENRTEAGRRLAAALAGYRDADPVVLALPRGGVPVALEVARALDAPLDLVLVRKIGAPFQPELAMGAVVGGIAEDDEPVTVLNEDVLRLIPGAGDHIEAERARQLEEIAARRVRYLKDRPRTPIAGRTAIVVDDGIATGATMKAALRALRRAGPARLVLAVPVAPADSLAELAAEADDCVCLATPDDFMAVGSHYFDFSQVTDDAVARMLAEAPG